MPALLRAEWLIAQYGIPIAIVLVLGGFLALGGAWTINDDPPTERVTETTEALSIESTYGSQAVVGNNSALYEPNTTLRNMPVYFYNGTQNVTVAVNTSLAPVQSTGVQTRLVLEYTADRNGQVFWENRTLLAASNETVDGNASTLTATLNMSAVRDFIEETRSAIGGVGTVQADLVATVRYETDRFSGTLNGSSRVVTTGRAYWFEGSSVGNQTHVTTTVREVTGERDMVSVLGIGALGVAMLIAAVGVVLLQRRGIDMAQIESELTRTRYDEWISKGEIPTKLQKAYVKTDTLVDLVDIAIDSNKRVIYDTEYDAYAVVETDVVYYYSEGDTGLDQWLDL